MNSKLNTFHTDTKFEIFTAAQRLTATLRATTLLPFPCRPESLPVALGRTSFTRPTMCDSSRPRNSAPSLPPTPAAEGL